MGELLFGSDSKKSETLLKEFKEAIKRVYPQVFLSLARLRERAGNLQRMESYSPKLFHALSLANRVAFKWEQFLHFDKHRLVRTVLPVPGDDENSVVMTIFPQETGVESKKEFLSLREDIEKEYKSVSVILEDLSVKVDFASSSSTLRTEENDDSIIH